MASAELRIIRRRIRSVQSTMKITRAMELIAGSRIVKAQGRVTAAQPYNEKLTEVIRNIGTSSAGLVHPLLEHRAVSSPGVVVISSDRGLAGGYNSSVIRLAERAILDHHHQGRSERLYVVGKKAQSYFRYRKYQIEQAWLGVTDTPRYGDARSIAATLMNDYAEGVIDSVEVYSTRFLSALSQSPMPFELLPISTPDVGEAKEPSATYAFEPSAEGILGTLLPRYVEAVAFGLLLEASASEHAARRRAMKAATEAADELTKVLTRRANQARQAEITTEISEIVGGAEALSAG